jgi:hypothetical protein
MCDSGGAERGGRRPEHSEGRPERQLSCASGRSTREPIQLRRAPVRPEVRQTRASCLSIRSRTRAVRQRPGRSRAPGRPGGGVVVHAPSTRRPSKVQVSWAGRATGGTRTGSAGHRPEGIRGRRGDARDRSGTSSAAPAGREEHARAQGGTSRALAPSCSGGWSGAVQSAPPLRRKVCTTVTVPLSILDLAHINVGETAADAFRASVDLAQHAEEWGHRCRGSDPHDPPRVGRDHAPQPLPAVHRGAVRNS